MNKTFTDNNSIIPVSNVIKDVNCNTGTWGTETGCETHRGGVTLSECKC